MLERPEEEAAQIEDQAETVAGANPVVEHKFEEQELGVHTTISNGEGPRLKVCSMPYCPILPSRSLLLLLVTKSS